MKTRVPDKLDDESSMRKFYDTIDRQLLKAGQLENASSEADAVTKLNALLAIFRTR